MEKENENSDYHLSILDTPTEILSQQMNIMRKEPR